MRRGLTVCAAFGVFAMTCAARGADQSPAKADAQLLRSAGISTDTPSLLQFFRNRSLKEADRDSVEALVRKLNSNIYKERDDAMRDLAARGPVALPFLRAEIARKTSLESSLRCEQIIRRIEASEGPDRAVAAARLLAERGVKSAVAALFDYIPHVDNDWARDRILASLAALTIHGTALDAHLSAALHDARADRRAAAAYILGRYGPLDQRAIVRTFFSDKDASVRRYAAQALIGKQTAATYRDLVLGDEALLQKNGVGTQPTALLDFLRKRTLGEADQQRLRRLIADLGAPSFYTRSRASKELIKQGIPALAFLKPALASADAEVVRRAALCIDEIGRGPGPALPAAVVRLLASPQAESSPAVAIRALLAYAPFADDDTVEDDIAAALDILGTRQVTIDPLLTAALRDPQPARRAVAARVLGKIGTSAQQADLQKLLGDPVLSVRVRAAQGLLHASDKTAVPKLIALLDEAPPAWLWQVEDTLQRLAGPSAPLAAVGDGTADKRKAAMAAWRQWWAANAATIDLARRVNVDAYQGLITVCEYDSANGRPGGQAWEIGRDRKIRWKITGLMGAMDAEVLPNGRVLIAENNTGRITERDQTGAVKWEYRISGDHPLACQRLPNGNTFIATYNHVMEITPSRRLVYSADHDRGSNIFSAQKLRDGQVVTMTSQGTVHRFDPITRKDYATIHLGLRGSWCSAEALPNGRYLVANMADGQVREIDSAGATLWTVTMPGAFRATRLPNGNTLVASMTTRQIAEFDRNGNKRWEKTCAGRPWSIRYR